MKAQTLKNKIIEENKIRIILEELGMKNIREHDNHFSCGMPDGDNKSSTIIYKNTLIVNAHTREISKEIENTDIISLVSFINKTYFSLSIKFICDVCGYNYYSEEKDTPIGLKWLSQLKNLVKGEDDDEDVALKPIDEEILKYYRQIPNLQFELDGIDLQTQKEFEIGIDLESHRITIPIRDELSTLVGIKGRSMYGSYLSDMKYIYLVKCPKSKILFGLNKTLPYIRQLGLVYVFESEKAVMQMWSKGVRNVVGIGNHQISKFQSNLLTMLGVDIIFCYDKEIGLKTRKNDKNEDIFVKNNDKSFVIDEDFWDKQTRFLISGQQYGIMYDRFDILKTKESPSDNYNNFLKLKENIIKKTKTH